MKKILSLILIPLSAVCAGAENFPGAEDEKSRLLAEIVSRAPSAGNAERRLISELEAAGGGMKKSAAVQGEDSCMRLIDVVWGLGEIGGADAERALVKAAPAPDPMVRLNVAVALDKIAERRGTASGDKFESYFSKMKPGDILFRKGYFGVLNSAIGAQTVGHVGLYAGVEDGKHMVIEGWLPVRKVTLKMFVGGWPFYGNYTSSPRPSAVQRAGILEYARAQLGKGYDMSHTVQKGPDKFDCVGLAEAAYESVGINPTPDEFEYGWGWPLTPTEQYEHTVRNF